MKEEVRKVVFAFDVLEYNGVSLLNCKLIDRRKLIPESEHIKQCEYT
jgi:ATP-dependent DNA ligase